MHCYIFRSVCLFWSKQAKNILKNIKILLLIAQFHNAPPNFANLASGRRALDAGAHNLFRNNGKKVRFHKIGLIMMPKRKGYKIYTMFLIYTCKRQDDQNWYSISHEMHFDNLFLERVPGFADAYHTQ